MVQPWSDLYGSGTTRTNLPISVVYLFANPLTLIVISFFLRTVECIQCEKSGMFAVFFPFFSLKKDSHDGRRCNNFLLWVIDVFSVGTPRLLVLASVQTALRHE